MADAGWAKLHCGGDLEGLKEVLEGKDCLHGGCSPACKTALSPFLKDRKCARHFYELLQASKQRNDEPFSRGLVSSGLACGFFDKHDSPFSLKVSFAQHEYDCSVTKCQHYKRQRLFGDRGKASCNFARTIVTITTPQSVSLMQYTPNGSGASHTSDSAVCDPPCFVIDSVKSSSISNLPRISLSQQITGFSFGDLMNNSVVSFADRDIGTSHLIMSERLSEYDNSRSTGIAQQV